MKAWTILAAALLCGCASSIMKGYIGQPLQAAMVDYGPPANAFDMGDGRRAFQWPMTSTGYIPQQSYTTGSATAIGNSVMWTQNQQITGGFPITQSCVYTLYARWEKGAQVWRVEGFEKPKFMCE